MSLTLPIEQISDTALVTAYCRALETERPDAHFRDPYARLLAGSRGEQLLRKLAGPELTASGCVVRTKLLDDGIRAAIRADGVDAVINLGAGLDTRPYRLPCPQSVCWFEVDSPDVLSYKSNLLRDFRPACSLERVPLDVFDVDARASLFRDVALAARNVLVLTEGLLVYMPPDQVASLAGDLHSWPQFRWWLSDIVSPQALQFMQRASPASAEVGKVRLLFAPDDGAEFFRAYGWETEELRSCLDEANRLDRRFLADALLSVPLSSEQRAILQQLYAVVKLRRSDQATLRGNSPNN